MTSLDTKGSAAAAGSADLDSATSEIMKGVDRLKLTAQDWLHMPKDPQDHAVQVPTDDNSPKVGGSEPAVSIRNHVRLELESILDVQWTPVEGFTLREIVLSLTVDLTTNKNATFSVRLQASSTIKGLDFVVSAELPQFRSGENMFIVFDAALVGSTSGDDLIDAAQQISGSNNASSNKWPKLSELGKQSQLDTSSLAALLSIVIFKSSKRDAEFQLLSLDAILGAQIDYKPLEQLDLVVHSGSFRLSLIRQQITATAFDTQILLQFTGLITISGSPISATVEFDQSKDGVRTILELDASTAPKPAAFGYAADTRDVSASQALLTIATQSVDVQTFNTAFDGTVSALPEDLRYIKNDFSRPGRMGFHLRTCFLGSTCQELSIAAFLASTSTFDASFLKGLSIDSLNMYYDAIQGRLSLCGSLHIGEMLFSVEIHVRENDKLFFRAVLQDGIVGNLAELACLDVFNDEAVEKPTDVRGYADAHKLPSEAPVDLARATDNQLQKYSTSIFVEFLAELTNAGHSGAAKDASVDHTHPSQPKNWSIQNVKFCADFGVSWALASDFKVTDLGICFTIDNPTNEKKKDLRGLLYGKCQLAQHTMLTYVVGKQIRDQTSVLIGLHLETPKQTTVAEVLTDTYFGDDLAIPSLDSLDSAQTDLGRQTVSADTSIDGVLSVLLVKRILAKGDTAGPDSGKISSETTSVFELRELRVRARLSSTFKLFGDTALADASVELRVSHPLEKGSRGFEFQVYGYLTIGSVQARLAGFVPAISLSEKAAVNSSPAETTVADKNVLQLTTELQSSATDMVFVLEAGDYDDAVTGARVHAPVISGEDFLKVQGTDSIVKEVKTAVPADCPVDATQLFASVSFRGSIVVSQVKETTTSSIRRQIKSLCLSLEVSKPWTFVTDKLRLENAKIQFTILRPDEPNPSAVTLIAHGTLAIGKGPSQSKFSARVVCADKLLTLGFIAQISLRALLSTLVDSDAVDMPPGLPFDGTMDPTKPAAIVMGVHCIIKDKLLSHIQIHARNIQTWQLSASIALDNLSLDYSASRDNEKLKHTICFQGDLVLGLPGSKKAFRVTASWQEGSLHVELLDLQSKTTEAATMKPSGTPAADLLEHWDGATTSKEPPLAKDYSVTTEMSIGDIARAILPKDICDAMIPQVANLSVVGGQLFLGQHSDNSWYIQNFSLHLKSNSVFAVGSLGLTQLDIAYKAVADPLTPTCPLSSLLTIERTSLSEQNAPVDPALGSKPVERGPSLLISGVVEKAATAARVNVSCIQQQLGSSRVVTVSLRPAREGSLSIIGIFILLSLQPPGNVEIPSDLKQTDTGSLQIKDMMGTMEVSTKDNSLAFTSFQLETSCLGTLKLLEAPTIETKDLTAVVQWSATSGIVAALCGRLMISKINSWLIYTKTDQGSTFTGFGFVESDAKPAELPNLAEPLSLPSDLQLPTDIGLPSELHLVSLRLRAIQGCSIEISAYGNNVWHGECGGIAFSLDMLGAWFKAEKDPKAADPHTTTYGLTVTGQLSFHSLGSVARAQLAIRSGRSKILSGSLKTIKDKDSLQSLASVGNDATATQWTNHVPASILSANMSDANLSVSIDLTDSKFLLTGHIDSLQCDAALFSKKLPPADGGRGLYISLAISDLAVIWPALKDSILQHIHIKKCVVSVVVSKGTLATISADMASLSSAGIGSKTAEAFGTNVTSLLSKLDLKTPLLDGTWFFADVEFTASTGMTDTMKQLVDGSSVPTITAYALVPRDGGAKTFSIALQNFTLFGGAISLADLQGEYTVQTSGDNKDQVNASGTQSRLTARATLKLGGLLASSLVFKSTFTIRKGSTVLTTKALGNNVPVKDPFFGSMFNVEIVQAEVTASFITDAGGKTTRSLMLNGGVRLGGDSSTDSAAGSPNLSGGVIFRDGKPVVVTIRYMQPLTVTDVFAKIVRPGDNSAGAWPSEFEPLTLKNACLYYNATSESITDETTSALYAPSFNLSTDLDLGFEKDITVLASVARAGLVVSGRYNGTIDMDFLQLDEATLTLNTPQKVYSFESRVKFFGISGILLRLDYHAKDSTSSERFVGKLDYKGDEAELKGSGIQITYQNGRFMVGDWKFTRVIDDLRELGDLAKKIEEASADGSPCGKIVGLVFDKVVKTSFDWSLSLPKGVDNKAAKKEKKPFEFTVEVYYTITVAELQLPRINLPSPILEISGPFDLKRLHELLWNFIKDNLGRIAESLIKDPQALGNLVAAMTIERCAKKAISSLLCRGSRNTRVTNQGKKLMEEELQQAEAASEGSVESALRLVNGGSALAGADIFGTLAAFGEAFGGGAFAALGVGGAALLSSLIKAVGSDDKDIAKYQEKAAKAVIGIKQKIEDHAKLVLALTGKPTVTLKDNDATVSVDWTSVAPALPKEQNATTTITVQWEVVVSPSHNTEDPIAKRTQDTATHFKTSDGIFQFASSIWTFVRGVAEMHGTKIVSAWTELETLHEALVTPKKVDLTIDPSSLPGSPTYLLEAWPQVFGQHYVLLSAFRDGSSDTVWKSELQHASSGSVPIKCIVPSTSIMSRVWDFTGIHGLAIHVTGTTEHQNSSSYATSSQSYPVLSGATNLHGTIEDTVMTLEWDQDGPASNDLSLKLTKAGQDVEISQMLRPDAPSGKRKAILTLKETYYPGEQISVEVKALTLPTGALSRIANTSLQVQTTHVLIPAVTTDADFVTPLAEETAFVEQNKSQFLHRLVFGIPVGSKLGGPFNWWTDILQNSQSWPVSIATNASVPKTAINLCNLNVAYNGRSDLNQHSTKAPANDVIEEYKLDAGERITALEVFLNPPSRYVSALGLTTDKGRTFTPNLARAGDGITKLSFAAPSGYALKGFWGRTGEYFDRIAPIWAPINP